MKSAEKGSAVLGFRCSLGFSEERARLLGTTKPFSEIGKSGCEMMFGARLGARRRLALASSVMSCSSQLVKTIGFCRMSPGRDEASLRVSSRW